MSFVAGLLNGKALRKSTGETREEKSCVIRLKGPDILRKTT